MAPVKNGRLLFNEIPEGFPVPGKTTVYDDSETIDLDNVPLKGGFLVKTLVLSIDPYLRGRMRDPNITSYAPPFHVGQPLDNFGVGVVLRSENSAVKKGDHIYGYFPFQEYSIRPSLEGYRILKNEEKLPWSVYVGVAGMPGQTAHHAWKEYAAAKPGDVVFVSAAAGPVGATVVQLAKAEGLKVIASAGSPEKVAFAKSIGADVAFNYKTQNTAEVLAKEGPINIYWDNVGGSTFDAALQNAARNARILACGTISDYNGKGVPVYNLGLVFAKEVKIFGFLVFHLSQYDDEFYRVFPKQIAEGKIKYKEDITTGLQYAGHAIQAVQTGTNKGKSVVVVAQE